MSEPRQVHLGAFMRPVAIHTGAWRYLGALPDANFKLGYLKQLARQLEAAKFDFLFMADHLAVLNMPYEDYYRQYYHYKYAYCAIGTGYVIYLRRCVGIGNLFQ